METNKLIHRRTVIVKFERQLQPQPPIASKPYFWGYDHLSFYQDKKEVWKQDIPEILQSHELSRLRFQSFGGVSVRRDKHFGWILVFEVSHQIGKKMFELLLKLKAEDFAHECKYVKSESGQFEYCEICERSVS